MSPTSAPPNPFLAAASSDWRLPALDDLFFVPGDWAVYLLATYAPRVAAELGVGAVDYGGPQAGVLSLSFWLLLSYAAYVAAALARRTDS